MTEITRTKTVPHASNFSNAQLCLIRQASGPPFSRPSVYFKARRGLRRRELVARLTTRAQLIDLTGYGTLCELPALVPPASGVRANQHIGMVALARPMEHRLALLT
jgi:hypothetical protein